MTLAVERDVKTPTLTFDTVPCSQSEVPVMVTQFNPTNPSIGSLMRNNWKIIQNTEELTKIFKDKPLVGYRRLSNLKDMLTSSSINYPPVPKPLGTPLQHVPVCTRLERCTYCPKLKKKEKSPVSTAKGYLNVRDFHPDTKLRMSYLMYFTL